jgi:hypothetical protein
LNKIFSDDILYIDISLHKSKIVSFQRIIFVKIFHFLTV